jgi:hypothetical protein
LTADESRKLSGKAVESGSGFGDNGRCQRTVPNLLPEPDCSPPDSHMRKTGSSFS